MSLFALVGAADNLDEPTPLINRRATIFGLVLTSLVRESKSLHEPRGRILTGGLDRHLILRQSATICQVLRDAMPWLGRHFRNLPFCKHALHEALLSSTPC